VYLVCVRIYGRARVPALQHLEPRFLQPMKIDVRAQDRLRALPQPQRREQGQLPEAMEQAWRKVVSRARREGHGGNGVPNWTARARVCVCLAWCSR